MKIELVGVTDQGLVREHNEDAILLADKLLQTGKYQSFDDQDFITAVADGVGGIQAGEMASRICLEELQGWNPPNKIETIIEKLTDIHKNIIAYGEEHESSKGLATTLAGIFLENGKIHSFHVGDSRVYRFRQGFLKQLTNDHSLVQALYESGMIKREEMDTHPKRHIVLQVLGGSKEVEIEPEVQEIRGEFLIDDVFVICTDGLSDVVSLIEMESCLNEAADLTMIAERLLDQAKASGGKDNISIILAKRIA